MRQRDLTLVAPIGGGRRSEVEQELDALGGELRGGAADPFRDVGGLHFLAGLVIDGSDGGPASVVLELDFDGPRRKFLRQLVERKRAELDRILRHCDGYPAPEPGWTDRRLTREVVRFLWRRRVRSGTFYVGHPGRSVERIRAERDLREKLREVEAANGPIPRRKLWEALCKAQPSDPPRPLPLRVRLSTRGGRGPRRVAAAAWLLAGGLLRAIGAAAFAALCWWAWQSQPAWRLVVAAPLALGLGSGALALLARPKQLKLRGVLIVLRDAARRGFWTAVAAAVGLGLLALVADAAGLSWGRESFLPADLLSGALRGLGSALVALLAAALAVAAGVLAFLLAGRIAGFALGVGFALAALAGSGAGVLFLDQPFETALLLTSLAGALLLLVSLLGGLAWYLYRLRKRERKDPVGGIRWNLAHLKEVTEHEDLQYQNHFASLTELKDGWRHWQLGAVLRLASLLVRFHFNRGDLAGIPSIHFARFIRLPDRRLLFLANFDAGWANYLGEFTDVPGVTAVWGSTWLFPRPFLVFGDGARDEQRFKSQARASQVKTRVWHSAYPGLGVAEIDRNTRLREDLSREVPLERWTGWSGDVKRFWKQPLDEAGLDEAIRGL